MELHTIARIENPFKEKFGIPRQSGLAESIESKIIFEKEFRNPDILRGLEEFSHLWLIWGFSETEYKWNPTVRPPRLGGNTRKGVFATRSPFRPNPLGMSSVRILKIDYTTSQGPVIFVSGADLMDKSPIYDIKPYISTDCHPDAICGFQESTRNHILKVECSQSMLNIIPENLRNGLLEILKQDPRPSYHCDQNRVYGLSFGGFQIKFTVTENTLYVKNIL